MLITYLYAKAIQLVKHLFIRQNNYKTHTNTLNSRLRKDET